MPLESNANNHAEELRWPGAGARLAIGGMLMMLTITGIPFGIQAFKLAGYTLWPLGRAVVPGDSAGVSPALGTSCG